MWVGALVSQRAARPHTAWCTLGGSLGQCPGGRGERQRGSLSSAAVLLGKSQHLSTRPWPRSLAFLGTEPPGRRCGPTVPECCSSLSVEPSAFGPFGSLDPGVQAARWSCVAEDGVHPGSRSPAGRCVLSPAVRCVKWRPWGEGCFLT